MASVDNTVYAIREDINQKPTRVHIVPLIAVWKKGGYRQNRTFSAWHDRQKAHITGMTTKSSIKPVGRPGVWLFVERFEWWNAGMGERADWALEHSLPFLDERKLPRIEHADLDAFFAEIGWNKKSKTYR